MSLIPLWLRYDASPHNFVSRSDGGGCMSCGRLEDNEVHRCPECSKLLPCFEDHSARTMGEGDATVLFVLGANW